MTAECGEDVIVSGERAGNIERNRASTGNESTYAT